MVGYIHIYLDVASAVRIDVFTLDRFSLVYKHKTSCLHINIDQCERTLSFLLHTVEVLNLYPYFAMLFYLSTMLSICTAYCSRALDCYNFISQFLVCLTGCCLEGRWVHMIPWNMIPYPCLSTWSHACAWWYLLRSYLPFTTLEMTVQIWHINLFIFMTCVQVSFKSVPLKGLN